MVIVVPSWHFCRHCQSTHVLPFSLLFCIFFACYWLRDHCLASSLSLSLLCCNLEPTKCFCYNTCTFQVVYLVLNFNWKKCCYFQGLSKSKISSKNSTCKLGSRRYNNNLPLGYRQVHINWFDLDKCNVCHMDEVQSFVFLFNPLELLLVLYTCLLFWCSLYFLFLPSPVV